MNSAKPRNLEKRGQTLNLKADGERTGCKGWQRLATALGAAGGGFGLAVAWANRPWCDVLGTALSHLFGAWGVGNAYSVGYGVAFGAVPAGFGAIAGWVCHAWARCLAGRAVFPAWVLPFIGALDGIAPAAWWWMAVTFFGAEG